MDLAGLLALRHRPLHRRRLAGAGHRRHRGAGAGAGPAGAPSPSASASPSGDVVWLTFAIVGLAALAQAFHGVFLVIKYAGAAYLLYIAYKLWTAPGGRAGRGGGRARPSTRPSSSSAGWPLTIGNPKVMVFYLALLPTILDLTRITLLGFAELVGGDPDRAGRGLCGLYRARRPRPAALHQPKGHPDPQPDHRHRAWRAPPPRSRHADAGPPFEPRIRQFLVDFPPVFHARVCARG